MLKQLIYRIIYNDWVNFILRNINKIFYPLLPNKIKLPPSGKMSLSVNTQKLIIKTNQTNYLTQLLYWQGYKNFEYTSIFLEIIKDFSCFFDIGANIGYYSLLAARVNPNIKITSFEPATGPLFYLRENVALNNFTNITIEPIAMSGESGTIEFYEAQNQKYKYLKYNLSGEGNTGSLVGKNFHKIIVPTMRLDDYINDHAVKSIDLIKMDTEGTENLILKGADKVLSELRPIVICETIFNVIEDQLEEIMGSHGYSFFNHLETGLQKVDSIRRTENNGVSNCFFVPSEKLELIRKHIVN
jgi:FkbM family methyltransferase